MNFSLSLMDGWIDYHHSIGNVKDIADNTSESRPWVAIAS
jgi:hypothetical protein